MIISPNRISPWTFPSVPFSDLPKHPVLLLSHGYENWKYSPHRREREREESFPFFSEHVSPVPVGRVLRFTSLAFFPSLLFFFFFFLLASFSCILLMVQPPESTLKYAKLDEEQEKKCLHQIDRITRRPTGELNFFELNILY